MNVKLPEDEGANLSKDRRPGKLRKWEAVPFSPLAEELNGLL